MEGPVRMSSLTAKRYLVIGHAAPVEILFQLLEVMPKPDLQCQDAFNCKEVLQSDRGDGLANFCSKKG